MAKAVIIQKRGNLQDVVLLSNTSVKGSDLREVMEANGSFLQFIDKTYLSCFLNVWCELIVKEGERIVE
jgi:hypothetical protein